MNQNPKQIILDVLNAIGYEDDKQKYVNDFLSLCLQKALVSLARELPQEKQDQLTQRLSLVSADKMEPILLEYFPKEKFEEAVKDASSSTFQEYLETIIPILNDDQRNKIEAYLSSQTPATA